MEECRKYVRLSEKAQISYSVVPVRGSKQYMTSDVSQGGIRFFVHDFIPKGSHLKIRMDFSRANVTIEAMVRLVWIRKAPNSDRHEIGVNFIDISSKAADRLTNYIKSFINTKSDMDCDPA